MSADPKEVSGRIGGCLKHRMFANFPLNAPQLAYVQEVREHTGEIYSLLIRDARFKL